MHDLTLQINQGQLIANSSCLLVPKETSPQQSSVYSTKSDMILILNVFLELNDMVNLLMNGLHCIRMLSKLNVVMIIMYLIIIILNFYFQKGRKLKSVI